jgi:hypothetical protein
MNTVDLEQSPCSLYYVPIRPHHHQHQGLDPLIRSVSRVTTVLANVSSVFQLFFFFVVCSDMISKGFGLVAFFASVKSSSVYINRLDLLVLNINTLCYASMAITFLKKNVGNVY